MSVAVVIQARVGSTRLPCKSMLSLAGFPIAEWVARRCARARRVDRVLLAVPDTAADDVLARHCEGLGFTVVRGPEQDVLRRMALAARAAGCAHVVRVCADRPLICPEELDDLVAFYEAAGCDYAYNHVPVGAAHPVGLGAEIVPLPLLLELDAVVTRPEHREHCLSHVTDNPGLFSIATYQRPRPLDHVKVDVDTFDDYRTLALSGVRIDDGRDAILDLFG